MKLPLVTDSKELKRAIQKKGLNPFIVADGAVAKLYPAPIEAPMLVFEGGEENKTRQAKERLENELLELGADKNACIIGFGGGVALDLAGFIAATLHRGAHTAFVPTSLLAMSDACFGGKNGVNTPHGKNLIGTLLHPEAILIDTDYLQTLPEQEIRCGKAEIIKHAFLADPSMLDSLDYIDEALIIRNLKIKASFIEKGSHMRHCLNFGHTIAHALEILSNYTLPHGLAVLKGMWIEALLSDCKDLDRIEPFVDQRPINYCPDILWEMLLRDKKTEQGRVHIVGLPTLASPVPLLPITKEMLTDVLSYAAR